MAGFHAGQLVRCVKGTPWIGRHGDIGPRYDDRLVVVAVRFSPRRRRPGLKFDGYPFAYDTRYFRPVVFTSSKQAAETKEPAEG